MFVFGLDLDANDARSYVEQSRAVFSKVLGTYGKRLGSPSESGAKRIIAAYNRGSSKGDELNESLMRRYLSGSQLPHANRVFGIGEALGPQDDDLNPGGCDCESSGLMMLIFAGYLQHAVLLLERAYNDPEFEPVTLMTYLEPAFVLAERPDDATVFGLMSFLPAKQRRVLHDAWDAVPKNSRFTRLPFDGLLAKAWGAVSSPTSKYFTETRCPALARRTCFRRCRL